MRFAGDQDVLGFLSNHLHSEDVARLPNFEQGPAQGPNSPIKYYPGMGYAPERA